MNVRKYDILTASVTKERAVELTFYRLNVMCFI